nr:MAPEG family protein [Jannaschia sp. S6380]
MAGWAVLTTVLAALSTCGKPQIRTESGHPARDYSDPFYRRTRAHLNAVESTGPFIAAAVAAILIGAPPFWVNLLASVFLVARIGMAIVHIGTENQPARSALFAVGLFCVIGLAGMALVGAVTA